MKRGDQVSALDGRTGVVERVSSSGRQVWVMSGGRSHCYPSHELQEVAPAVDDRQGTLFSKGGG